MDEDYWTQMLDLGSERWEPVAGWKGWLRWIHPLTDEVCLFHTSSGVMTGWVNAPVRGGHTVHPAVRLKSMDVPDSVITWFCLKYDCQEKA